MFGIHQCISSLKSNSQISDINSQIFANLGGFVKGRRQVRIFHMLVYIE